MSLINGITAMDKNRQTKSLGRIPLLALIAAIAVAAAGCAVGQSALPLLPPAPVRSTGTFAVSNNLVACPAGSTPSNPGAASCSITSGASTVDVLADAFVGGNYTFTIITRGGTIPVTSCQIQGTIPTGITLSAAPSGANCIISGTLATSVGLAIPVGGFAAIPLTVRATDSGNPAASDTQDVVIRVFAGFTFTTATIENGTQGRAFSKTIVSNLGTGVGLAPMASCTMTGAPAGLTIAASGNNCLISGTPTASGTFTVTVTGTDSAASVRSSPAYTLLINPPLTVGAPAFTNGTQGRAYIALTVNTAGGNRPLTACTATGLPAGMAIAVNPANTAANVNSCIISGTPTASGAFPVVVSATDTATPTTATGTSSAATTTLTINPPLAVTAFTMGNGTQGRAFTQTIATTGGQAPLTACTAAGMPSGLTIAVSAPSSCVISGIPTVSGAFGVVATVTDTATTNTLAGSASSASTPLTVNPPLAIPAFTLQTGAEGATFTATVPTSGGNRPLTSCTATGLAAGLLIATDPANTAINTNNCIVSGTPAGGSAGAYTVVVTANDTASTTTLAGSASSANTPLTINGPLVIPPFTLGNGTTNRTFQQDIPVTGGIQPLTNCSISAGALPAGLSIAVSATPGNCRISGTPTAPLAGAAVVSNFTVSATDTGVPPGTPPATATQAGSVTTNSPLIITTVANTVLDAVTGRAGYTLAFANAGGQTTFSWSSAGLGAGPCTGMSLSAAGAFSGTPTVAGTCNFTASVTDTATTSTAAGTTNGGFTLTVRPEFTVTQPSFADGVESRTYGNAPQIQPVTTNVLAVAGPSDFGQVENGNGPLVSCAVTAVVVSSGAPTTPLTTANFTALVDATANQCRLQSVGVFPAGSVAVYRVTVSATDNAIAGVSVPAGTQSTSLLLAVQPALTLAENVVLVSPFPDAVTGRNYGVGNTCGATGTAACLAPTYLAAGGVGIYTFTGEATLPTGFTCTAANVNPRVCSAAPVTAAAAGPTATTMSVADAGNTAVPAGNANVVRNITVQPVITNAANAAVNPPPPAVQARPYGGTGFTPLTYTASGGLGLTTSYTFTPIPAAAVPPGPGIPTGITCTAGGAGGSVLTCNTPGVGTVTAAGSPVAYSYNVDVSDVANASTPSGSAPTLLQSITVNAGLLLTGSGAAGSNPMPDAVSQRPYGSVGTCSGGACLPASYAATGGLGTNTAGYLFTGGASFPTGFTCTQGIAPNADTFACSANPVTNAAAPFTPTIVLNDTANATTPSGLATTTTSSVALGLTVRGALTFAINLTQAGPGAGFTTGPAAGNNPVTVPDGVDLRPYGPSVFDGTRSPLQYTASGGLSPYGFSASGSFPSTTAGAGIFCNGLIAGITVQCDTTNGLTVPAGTFPAGASATSPYAYDITATDTFNASVPVGAVNIRTNLTIRPALAQTLNPASPFPNAVNGRRYGSGVGCSLGACVPVTYTVTAGTGLGGYVFTNTGGFLAAPGAGYPNGFACGTAANVFTCSAAPSVTGTAGNYTPSVNINDAANATTPNSNAVSSLDVAASLDVVNEIAITTIALQNGTQNRAFGSGSGVGPNPPNVDMTISFGLTPYASCVLSGTPPAGLTTAVAAVSFCRLSGAPTVNGTGFGVIVTATDTANISAPSNSAVTASMTLDVNAPLVITTAAALNGAATTVFYTTTLANSGGQTPFTWSEVGANLGAAACTGLSLTSAGVVSGIPTTPGTCTFTAQVADTLTTTTGSGTDTRLFTITVAPPVSMAAWLGGPEDAATEGRPIGGGTGGPLDYVISNGIGPFTCAQTGLPVGSGLNVPAAPVGGACRLQGTPNAIDAAAPLITVTITVTDTATTLTSPVTTAPFDVFTPISVNGSTGTGGTAYPASVQNRPYSLSPVPVAGGNQNGIVTLTALTAVNCTGLALAGGNITGTPTDPGPVTCLFDLSGVDAATRMAAAGSLIQTGNTLAVNAPLSLTPAAPGTGVLPHGVVALAYNNGTPIPFTVAGGIGPYTFFDPTDAAGAQCGAVAGSFPPGLNLPPTTTATTANLTGTPTLQNMGAPLSYVFNVCVEDTGNGSVTAASRTEANYSVSVMQPLAFAAAPGDETVQVIRTSPIPGIGVIELPTSITTSGTNPHSSAVTPSGREVWVSLEGSNSIDIFDTVDFSLVTTIDLIAGTFSGVGNTCTGPRGIVHGVPGTTSANRTYVACSTVDRITVIDTAARTRVAGPATSGGIVTDLAITPDGTRVYATLGTINDVDLVTTATNLLTTVTNIMTGDSNGGIAVAPDGTRFFVGDATADELVMVTIPAHVDSIVGTYAGGDVPSAIAFNETGTRVYVTLNGPDLLDVRNGSTGAAVTQVSAHRASIATASRTTNVVTITTANEHGFTTAQSIAIAGVTTAGPSYSAGSPFAITVTSPTTFTYAQAAADDATGTGGTATAGGTNPFGITIPPNDSGSPRVFTVLTGLGQFVVHTESATPTRESPNQINIINNNPFNAVAASGPTRISHIPRPRP